ncbi:MAG: helix-turn-helix domain-containing protein [Armatimonadetes bacterium]|nr:helix-turn-helix domain-containing protein [Armatimonadota bacterium]
MDRLLRAEEVAEILNVKRACAYRLMQHEVLPVVRLNRAVRVPKSELERWIREHTERERARVTSAATPPERGE